MKKMVFENSKYLPLKIAGKNFRPYILPYGQKFLHEIFNGENYEFSKTVFTSRFLGLWSPDNKKGYKNFQKFRQIFHVPLLARYKKIKLTMKSTGQN